MYLLIASLRGRFIVSCQAYPDEPMRCPETMAQIALAAERGGAAAIRCQGLADIAVIRGRVGVPVIGLQKEGHEDVYIAPTLRHIRACSNAGTDVVAVGAAGRLRPDGLTFAETVRVLKFEGVLVMADCGFIDDARRAAAAGCAVLSTTLAGYTDQRPHTDGPDVELLEPMIAEFPEFPVICEGRIYIPEHAEAVMAAGAWAAVVGTAVTHPTTITGWFDDPVRRGGERAQR